MTIPTRSLIPLLAALWAIPAPTPAVEAPNADALIDRALQGAHRDPANRARDVYRHPKQTLRFFGLAPGMTVVEISPGRGGWYTEILAPVLRESGTLYAAGYGGTGLSEYQAKSQQAFEDKLKAQPEIYDRVILTAMSGEMAPAGSADLVLTFRNVHNWLQGGNADAVFAAAYRALKPGGILGVVEHRAHPGTSPEQTVKSGYVTEAQVIALAEKAGFKLAEKSEINANPKDTKDYPEGVWTLPPSLRLGEKDRAKYLAIGESDRMTLKFRK